MEKISRNTQTELIPSKQEHVDNMAQTEEVPESHLEDFQVEAQDLVAHAEEHNSSSEFFVAHA